jgi:hypothetical protein
MFTGDSALSPDSDRLVNPEPPIAHIGFRVAFITRLFMHFVRLFSGSTLCVYVLIIDACESA